ncbi:MAG: hypothetical protein AB3N28_00495 [Kordiimonas sp.]
MQQVTAQLRRNGTPWKYLLLGLFLFAQSFAASHEVVHIAQDIQEETCILCHSNDNNPADTAFLQPAAHTPMSSLQAALGIDNAVADNVAYLLNARAPPLA